MQDTEGAGNLSKLNSKKVKQPLSLMVHGKHLLLKDAKVNYGVATIPTLPNGKEYAAFGGGKAWVIPTGAKTQKLLKNSLTSLTSTDQQKHFTMLLTKYLLTQKHVSTQ